MKSETQGRQCGPTVLHYAVTPLRCGWVLSCESVPVACYENVAEARRAADTHILAARRRGDCALLEMSDENTVAA